jgi:two-component system, response regulator PdtaR
MTPACRTVAQIVEDDAPLRMFSVDVVEEAGFVAIEATDADAAICLLECRSDIALLLTDIDMPGSVSGLKLAHVARNRWPPIKILIMSGHVRPQPTELPLGARFVAKPCQSAALIAELHALTCFPAV